MEDRTATIVYLPRKAKNHFQAQADREGTSLSAVLRRELLAQVPKSAK